MEGKLIRELHRQEGQRMERGAHEYPQYIRKAFDITLCDLSVSSLLCDMLLESKKTYLAVGLNYDICPKHSTGFLFSS